MANYYLIPIPYLCANIMTRIRRKLLKHLDKSPDWGQCGFLPQQGSQSDTKAWQHLYTFCSSSFLIRVSTSSFDEHRGIADFLPSTTEEFLLDLFLALKLEMCVRQHEQKRCSAYHVVSPNLHKHVQTYFAERFAVEASKHRLDA